MSDDSAPVPEDPGSAQFLPVPPEVGVVMGSDSDWVVMSDAAQALRDFGVAHEVDVVSAHRMPEDMIEYGRSAASRGTLCRMIDAAWNQRCRAP